MDSTTFDYLSDNVNVIAVGKSTGATHLELAQTLSVDGHNVTPQDISEFCWSQRIVSVARKGSCCTHGQPTDLPKVLKLGSEDKDILKTDGIYNFSVPANRVASACIENNRFKYMYYHTECKCERCGRPLLGTVGKDWDIYHVDEDVENCLLTNLEGLCHECSSKFHHIDLVQPYIEVGATADIQAAHYLPGYDGKCLRTHGHRYEISIAVRHRIDPDTGMGCDFHKLKAALNQLDAMIDHNMLNDFIVNPTSERLAMWCWLQLSKEIKGLSWIKIYEGRLTFLKLRAADMLDIVDLGRLENEWVQSLM